MPLKRVLFQGSPRSETEAKREAARRVAKALGGALIREGFGLVLTGSSDLDAEVGRSARSACEELNVDPRERITTIPYGSGSRHATTEQFGMVLLPLDNKWYQEVRTFVVQQCDAVVAVSGGRGTSDVLQKATLAGKPVFPIAIAGAASQVEWERLKRRRYSNRDDGDLDFLGDQTAEPNALAARVAEECKRLLEPPQESYSRRVFIVHGREAGLKNRLARLLERLDFIPIILNEQPDQGRTILEKLRAELRDVGYASSC